MKGYLKLSAGNVFEPSEAQPESDCTSGVFLALQIFAQGLKKETTPPSGRMCRLLTWTKLVAIAPCS